EVLEKLRDYERRTRLRSRPRGNGLLPQVPVVDQPQDDREAVPRHEPRVPVRGGLPGALAALADRLSWQAAPRGREVGVRHGEGTRSGGAAGAARGGPAQAGPGREGEDREVLRYLQPGPRPEGRRDENS